MYKLTLVDENGLLLDQYDITILESERGEALLITRALPVASLIEDIRNEIELDIRGKHSQPQKAP